MITDANHIPQGSRLRTDLCIIGAGPAGITLALALRRAGLDIVLLESGGEEKHAATQALYEGTVQDARLHSAPDTYRVRRFGGSSTLWGGRCMPLDPIDFERRDYIPDSGWPFGADALAPYYPRANRLCEAGDFAYRAQDAFPGGMKPMIQGFESDEFSTDFLERFSCPTDFGRRYRHLLADSAIRVLTHANCCGFEPSPAGGAATDAGGGRAARVGAAIVRTLRSTAFTVEARTYVLATGGLETARLLLASPGNGGRGLGNRHDAVGRYYMCHIAGTIGTVDLSAAAAVWHGYQRGADGVYCRRRLALSAPAQRRLGAGNFIARLHHPRIPDPGHGIGILSLLYLARPAIPYEYARRLYEEDGAGGGAARGNRRAHLANVVRDLPGTAAFLWHWLRRRTLAERKFPSIVVSPRNRRYTLDFHAEQAPGRDSRVTLGGGLDALGVPKLHVDWRYQPRDVHTVATALARLDAALRHSGVGRFDYDPERVEAEMTRYGAYGGHHIGTARMGGDPRTSVVDADCRLHEADNLFLAGSAVFPTSGQANPTLTIVALALRLADHLRSRM